MILFFGIAGGNMFQANQTFAQLRDITGGGDGPLGGAGAALIFGVLLALVVGLVIFGGIRSIGRVTSRLVPTMAIVYLAACLVVIAVNLPQVPAAFGAILSGAFTGAGVAGGAVGALIVGFQRAAFSNEAGLGSASIAHSAVRTRHPVAEGYVALLEPFIDTVVVCTMTALTIIIAGTPFWREAQATALAGGDTPDGVLVTSDAFATVLPWFPYVLTVAVALFALSTMITWAYYGQKAWTYLFGKSSRNERVYQVLFCVFVVVGSVLTLGSVLAFADAVLFLLALFNIIGLYLLAPGRQARGGRVPAQAAQRRGQADREGAVTGPTSVGREVAGRFRPPGARRRSGRQAPASEDARRERAVRRLRPPNRKLPSSNGGVGPGPGDVGLGRVGLVWRRHGSRSVGVVETLLRVLLAAYLVAEVNETLEARRLQEPPLDVGCGLHCRIDTPVVHQVHLGWRASHTPTTARPNLLEPHVTDVPDSVRHRPPCVLKIPAPVCAPKLTVT